ncbi:MAG: citramalate synthase, partial [Dehalococcoidia bacterium]|nr:citramalate synthase [Dehalococcoidia bacterium]
MRSVQLYDTTLRDGAQREGISFSVEDKLKIAHKLDELGVHFIEGGWPGSNPKDSQFFLRARSERFKHATLVAFGSTKRHDIKAEDDPNLRSLVDSGVKVVTIVGKSSRKQVTEVLGVDLETNLEMVRESIAYLVSKGLRVFFDAEHFFDGYRLDPDYSLRTLKVAAEAGAECLVLCDTNGGSLPSQVTEAVRTVCQAFKNPIGIHAHNDAELAVANSLAAVEAGASQVQGTINGYGERCGNANLCSIIPNLKLKMGINCISSVNLSKLADTARFVAGVANMTLDRHLPYVG